MSSYAKGFIRPPLAETLRKLRGKGVAFNMKIEKLVVGQLATNCYLIYDEKTLECLIIDPGDDADFIERKITDLKLKPKMIVTTHGHFDHLLAVTELKLAYSLPFFLHEADLFLLKRTVETAKHFLKISVDSPSLPDKFLKEGEVLKIGEIRLKILETPGHTPGSICLTTGNVVFTGDTLFTDGVGRTDFSYSSKENLQKSLEKICKLGVNLLIYPGHGESYKQKSEFLDLFNRGKTAGNHG